MDGPGTTHEDFESIKSVLDVQSCVCGSLRGHFGRGGSVGWLGGLRAEAD